jgi:hypothetical protein
LNLPGQLRNDRLKLSNDQLAIDIAKLEKKRPSLTQRQLTESCSRLPTKSIVFFLPDDGSARDLRTRVSELDKRLDNIASACHSGASAGESHPIGAKLFGPCFLI